MNAALETRIDFPVLVKSKCEERRSSSRVRTVFRIARARTDIDERFCRVQNISDEGMMFATSLDVAEGGRILIALSDKIAVGGEVVWADEGRIGIRFEKPVDSAGILQMLAEEASTGAYRLPR
ncbi:MAG: PilZ domain-containing protein, partial [Novosphingobium sp.]|nr:PilZ domain-containing protein [Novosphingobium sp.]